MSSSASISDIDNRAATLASGQHLLIFAVVVVLTIAQSITYLGA